MDFRQLQPAWSLFWRHLKPALVSPSKLIGLTLRILSILKSRGLRGALEKFSHKAELYAEYPRWVELYDTLSNQDCILIKAGIAHFIHPPGISLLMCTGEATEEQVFRAIDSVRAQIYPYWELCITTMWPPDSDAQMRLDTLATIEPRIKLATMRKNTRADANNKALSIATGKWVVLLDPQCEISEYALYLIAEELGANPDAEVIYSDTDSVDLTGRRHNPCFKPDWNPDLLLSQNYFGDFTIYRTEQLRQQGGFRAEAGDAASWDVALRLTDGIASGYIRHISRVLCHRREAYSAHRPHSDAARRVLETHLRQKGIRAAVAPGHNGYWRIKYTLPDSRPLVSIIIPTRNGLDLLAQCITTILEKTAYTPFEIMVVDNQTDDSSTLEYLHQLEKKGIARVLRYNAPFNYSAINNFAVSQSEGKFLCFLNNDIEVIHPDWLEELVSLAARPSTGAVGAMLYYPDGSVQHGGVMLKGKEVATHFFAHMPASLLNIRSRSRAVQNLSAVTAACLVTEKKKFIESGGFDENLTITCNDIDLCLRLREKGYWNTWTPYSELYHHESATRGFDDSLSKQARIGREKAYMVEKWGAVLDHDPAYNPNLGLDQESYSLSFPPRKNLRPWIE